MGNCPVCETKLAEKAIYCHACGARVADAPNERAWVVAMQERIRDVRRNDVIYDVVAVVGLLIAVAIPFVMRYVLLYNMDLLSWILTGIGALLFFGGIAITWYDGRRIKELILTLQKGQPATAPEADTETNPPLLPPKD